MSERDRLRAKNKRGRKPWIETGKPTDDEVRAWRGAHVVEILRSINGAIARAKRLKVLLDDQERYGAAPLRRQPEPPEVLYALAMQRAAKLEREVELLYLLLEARSLGTIRGGKLVIGGIVSQPARPRLDELAEVRAGKRKIEAELDRLTRGRRPARAALPTAPAGPQPRVPAARHPAASRSPASADTAEPARPASRRPAE